MKKMLIGCIVMLVSVVCLAEEVSVESTDTTAKKVVTLEDRWGINLNFPGIGIKYGLSAYHILELKSQLWEGVFVLGSRYHYNYNPQDQLIFLGGVEIDYIGFKGASSEGIGLAVGLFIGSEYFVTPNISAGIDIGPTYITLQDKDTKETENGISFVLNIGLTYYFEGGKK
ncbi:MAG: hypothetical protein ABH873_05700 [Candidatus Firestonebacteria bacterium]